MTGQVYPPTIAKCSQCVVKPTVQKQACLFTSEAFTLGKCAFFHSLGVLSSSMIRCFMHSTSAFPVSTIVTDCQLLPLGTESTCRNRHSQSKISGIENKYPKNSYHRFQTLTSPFPVSAITRLHCIVSKSRQWRSFNLLLDNVRIKLVRSNINGSHLIKNLCSNVSH